MNEIMFFFILLLFVLLVIKVIDFGMMDMKL